MPARAGIHLRGRTGCWESWPHFPSPKCTANIENFRNKNRELHNVLKTHLKSTRVVVNSKSVFTTTTRIVLLPSHALLRAFAFCRGAAGVGATSLFADTASGPSEPRRARRIQSTDSIRRFETKFAAFRASSLQSAPKIRRFSELPYVKRSFRSARISHGARTKN